MSKENNEVDVLVEVFQGVISNVRVLSHALAVKEWRKWAEKHGYTDYEHFVKTLREQSLDHELRWYRVKLER